MSKLISTDRVSITQRFAAQFGSRTNPDPCPPQTPSGRMTKHYSDWAAEVGVYAPLNGRECLNEVKRLLASGWTPSTHVGLSRCFQATERTLRERVWPDQLIEEWAVAVCCLDDDVALSSLPREVVISYLTDALNA